MVQDPTAERAADDAALLWAWSHSVDPIRELYEKVERLVVESQETPPDGRDQMPIKKTRVT